MLSSCPVRDSGGYTQAYYILSPSLPPLFHRKWDPRYSVAPKCQSGRFKNHWESFFDLKISVPHPEWFGFNMGGVGGRSWQSVFLKGFPGDCQAWESVLATSKIWGPRIARVPRGRRVSLRSQRALRGSSTAPRSQVAGLCLFCEESPEGWLHGNCVHLLTPKRMPTFLTGKGPGLAWTCQEINGKPTCAENRYPGRLQVGRVTWSGAGESPMSLLPAVPVPLHWRARHLLSLSPSVKMWGVTLSTSGECERINCERTECKTKQNTKFWSFLLLSMKAIPSPTRWYCKYQEASFPKRGLSLLFTLND